MSVRRVEAQELHFRGPLRAAAVFIASDAEAARFHLTEARDDFDVRCEAFFDVDGVPAAVERYAGNPPNEFTVTVDVVAAQRCEVTPGAVARRVVTGGLHVREKAIVWRVDS